MATLAKQYCTVKKYLPIIWMHKLQLEIIWMKSVIPLFACLKTGLDWRFLLKFVSKILKANISWQNLPQNWYFSAGSCDKTFAWWYCLRFELNEQKVSGLPPSIRTGESLPCLVCIEWSIIIVLTRE